MDSVELRGGGAIGMIAFPGRNQIGLRPRERGADADLERVRKWGAFALLTLVEPHELAVYGAPDLGEWVARAGLEWHHLPISDMHPPDERFDREWARNGPTIVRRLNEGERIVVHCAAGLGRAGTLTARLLIGSGMDANDAIAAVRRARPGAIESSAQVAYLRGLSGPV